MSVSQEMRESAGDQTDNFEYVLCTCIHVYMTAAHVHVHVFHCNLYMYGL